METQLKINLDRVEGTFAGFLPVTNQINQGEVVKIDGVNGSGKTTLLKILSGLSPNYSGNIFINEYDLRYNLIEYKSNLQFIGAQDGLYPDLTAQQNLSLFSKLWSKIDNSAAGLHFFKIKDYADEKVSNLSSGTRRKIALARLIACPALIWMIDEMDAFLDNQSCLRLKGLIGDRIAQGGTVFFSSQRDVFDELVTSKIDLKTAQTSY